MNDNNLVSEIHNRLPNELYDYNEAARRFEAKLIAEKITGLDFSQLILKRPNIEDLCETELLELDQIINQRSTGKPLAYILKQAYFRGIELFVDDRVLIPRPETELLVDKVLSYISAFDTPKVLEIGVGSGAISLSVASEHSKAVVMGTDISKDAIDVANMNKTTLGIRDSSAIFLCGDLFEPIDCSLKNSFDVIVSNPPYIGYDEKASISTQVLDFEPHSALFAQKAGFEFYERIIELAKGYLTSAGAILFEISPRHEEGIRQSALYYGYSNCEFFKDLTGRTRIAQINL